MSDVISPPADASWRLLVPADTPFVYYLVAQVDPRWWRFSRHGLEPMRLLETAKSAAAGVLIADEYGQPMACAILADAGASDTGILEYFALPNPRSQELARRFAPEIVGAAFDGAAIRRIYFERFKSDPDLLGELSTLFEVEVTYPEFAMIDGRYEDRTTLALTSERFASWREATRE